MGTRYRAGKERRSNSHDKRFSWANFHRTSAIAAQHVVVSDPKSCKSRFTKTARVARVRAIHQAVPVRVCCSPRDDTVDFAHACWAERSCTVSLRSHRNIARQKLAGAVLECLEGRTLFSGYNLTAAVHDPNPESGSGFGLDIATHGNLAIVGAPAKSGGGDAALIDTTTGTVIRHFINPDAESSSTFGTAVAFFADGKIAISDPGHASTDGAIYVYDNASDTTPTVVNNPFPTTESGHVSGWGKNIETYGNTLLVATNEGTSGDGEVNQVDLSGAAVQVFDNPSGDNGFNMGVAMAVSGDNILINGTTGPIVAGATQGVVWEFDGTSGSLLQTLSEPSATANDAHGFGAAVAYAGADILVGAPSDDLNNFVFDGGFVYQFEGDGSYVRTYSNPEGVLTGQQYFGGSISVNGDKVMISARGQLVDSVGPAFDDNGDPILDENGDPVLVPTSYPAGKAFVFDHTAGELEATIANPTPPTNYDQSFESFGAATGALPDGGFVITDSDDMTDGPQTGIVYVYAKDAGTPENAAPSADAGADRNVAEGTTVNFSGAGSTDPDGASDIVSYQWDYNYDGVNFDIDATGVSTSVTYNDNGTHTVALRVTDSAGNTSIDSSLVTVQNVGPTASISGAPASSNEGSSINLTGDATDPSSVDTAAGIAKTWTVTKNGNAFATGSGSSFSFTPDDNGTYVVNMIATDKDGDAGSDQKTITVNNVNPSPSISGPTSGTTNQALNFTGTFTDPGTADTHTRAWTAKLGSSVVATGSGASFSFTPNSAGTYTVSYTVTDDDNGAGTSTTSVVVTNPAPPPPVVGGAVDSNGNLVVTGSNGSDAITVTRNSAGASVLTINGTTTTFTHSGRIIVNAGDGIDVIAIGSTVTKTAEVHGGAGADLIRGGGGNDVLVGDSGIDLLVGGAGRDLLIGGTDSDLIVGNTEDDILVAGTTSHDHNSAALMQVLSIWTGSGSYNTRVNTLRNGMLTPDQEVFDDGATDLLTGDEGKDWFLFNADAGGRDIITDLANNEFASDLDFINGDV